LATQRKREQTTGFPAVRRGVQLLFLVIVCFIGFRFSLFVGPLEKGLLPVVDRPPGVEAFLPISALVSLKHFVLTGTLNEIHPSGLVLFLIICATALIVRKGFCGWVCPFGLLSEYLTKLHFLIFRQGVRLPRWLDRVLRTGKYLLAAFFIWSIFIRMPLESVQGFIYSPYNILADIKMFRFFSDISMTALLVILALVLLSVLIRNFWCRYLCPYGALLGGLSILSAGRIHYDRAHCSHCGKCEKNCPGLIDIQLGKSTSSLECNACLQCVDGCPEEGALTFSLFHSRFSMGSIGVGLSIVLLFVGGIALAKLNGHWQNRVSPGAYHYHMRTQGMVAANEVDNERSKKANMERMIRMMQKMRSEKGRARSQRTDVGGREKQEKSKADKLGSGHAK